MHRLITLACLLTAVVGIKEQSFGRIKALNGPVVRPISAGTVVGLLPRLAAPSPRPSPEELRR